MSRYNHFSIKKYKQIPFKEIEMGEKFRMDKFDGKRRRADIVMVKTSNNSYEEFKSKREFTTFSGVLIVYSYVESNQASVREESDSNENGVRGEK